MSIYCIENATAAQKDDIPYDIIDSFTDGSINVEVPDDEVDEFTDMMDDMGLKYELV